MGFTASESVAEVTNGVTEPAATPLNVKLWLMSAADSLTTTIANAPEAGSLNAVIPRPLAASSVVPIVTQPGRTKRLYCPIAQSRFVAAPALRSAPTPESTSSHQ